MLAEDALRATIRPEPKAEATQVPPVVIVPPVHVMPSGDVMVVAEFEVARKTLFK